MLPVAAGCEGASVEGEQAGEVESTQQPIYNGVKVASLANAGPLGVPVLNMGCSAVVYSKYWLITAAHCFGPSADPQGDWVYWNTDVPGGLYATGLQTSPENQGGTLNVLAAFRNPKFSQDTALVLLDPKSSGAYLPAIWSYTGNRNTNGHLVIYGSSNASLSGKSVLAYGWGPTGEPDLTRGYKTVGLWPSSEYYSGLPYNNGGTNCPGDSGGPDFWWDGGGMQLTGIHARVGCAQGASDLNNGAEAFRTWVKETAATVPMGQTVTSEQLSNDWSASNASDYDPSTSYSSNSFPSSTPNRDVWLQTYLKTAGTVNRINMRARCYNSDGKNFGKDYNNPSCVVNGFPAKYEVRVWNGSWNLSGTFNKQPDKFGVVSLPIPAVSNATAVRITPVTLGKDINGSYYFQLAELQPANDL
jgi:hypothetical protein